MSARLERMPVRRAAALGVTVFLLVCALVVAGGFALAPGRGQQLVYADRQGDIVSLNPYSGERTLLYSGDGHAASPRIVGARGLTFTVFKGEGESLRGELYTADPVQRTVNPLLSAASGEAYIPSAFSPDTERIASGHFTGLRAPNVVTMPASSAERTSIEPRIDGRPALFGPEWGRESGAYMWSLQGERISLIAYDALERRRVEIYETEDRVGAPVYLSSQNAVVFSERPQEAEREESELRAFVGGERVEISGAQGVGIYDPSPAAPGLGGKVAVVWTAGRRGGLGLVDPADWSFEKTDLALPEGATDPRISEDGSLMAYREPGGALAVRALDDGESLRRVKDVQAADAPWNMMEEAGFRVPAEARQGAPAGFGWRSVEGEG